MPDLSPLLALLPHEGMIEPPSLAPQDIYNRPVLHNPGGGYSTTSSIGVGTGRGEAIIPTVLSGFRVTPEQAMRWHQRTGQHLGIFDTPEHGDKYAQALHEQQALMYELLAQGVSHQPTAVRRSAMLQQMMSGKGQP